METTAQQLPKLFDRNDHNTPIWSDHTAVLRHITAFTVTSYRMWGRGKFFWHIDPTTVTAAALVNLVIKLAIQTLIT
jgi:hypothetical protein